MEEWNEKKGKTKRIIKIIYIIKTNKKRIKKRIRWIPNISGDFECLQAMRRAWETSLNLKLSSYRKWRKSCFSLISSFSGGLTKIIVSFMLIIIIIVLIYLKNHTFQVNRRGVRDPLLN